jgi:coenzyme F420-reducing hydrogenase alpha subunit
VLHAAMLHAPDFLGLDDALQLAKINPDVVKTALKLKQVGNHMMDLLGGRAVHPVNARVGGFYKAPKRDKVRALAGDLRWGVEASAKLLDVFKTFDFPDYEYDYLCVSLKHPDEYAIHEGRLVTNRGLDIPITEFDEHFEETHVAHSNALHGHVRATGEPYLVGPIARYNNNFDQLSETARQAAKDAGLDRTCNNPFKSLLIRMVETLYVCEEGARLAEAYEEPERPFVEAAPRAGVGYGCTEAPRGICWHTYSIDDEGRILTARIVPPTSQNQPQIERDLLGVVQANIDMADEDLKWRCEQTIRNYDPCISCATHFLDLRVDRD